MTGEFLIGAAFFSRSLGDADAGFRAVKIKLIKASIKVVASRRLVVLGFIGF